ncbi:MAG: HIT domain-containing protein [Coriobacteriia bacterium]|nr:HIT domain-containing protein [Coriobacteriia bacterium]
MSLVDIEEVFVSVDNCVFCMIAAGEMGAHKVFEDDEIIAFDDIAPQAPVHTLIIPKAHYVHIGDNVPVATIAALFGAIPKIAEMKGVASSGYRVIVNNGRDANQTVGHLHVHVLGGQSMSHGMVNFVE